MIKIVSFDVWNTLLNLSYMLEELSETLSKFTGLENEKVKITIAEVRREVRELREEEKLAPEQMLVESQSLLSKRLNIDIDLVKRAIAKAMLNVTNDVVLKGVEEALVGLKEKGYVIITAGNVMFWPSSYTRLILEKYGIASYIDKQFYSDEVKAYKPMKEFFEKVMEYFKALPNEIVHVGDTREEDFYGALRAGLYAILINPHLKGYRKVAERGYEIGSIGEVSKVLEELHKESEHTG